MKIQKKLWADNRDLHSPTGPIAIGSLIVEDLFTILVLVLLPAYLGRPVKPGGGIGSVLTHGTYLCNSPMLRAAGANAVFSSEGEIVLRMTEFLMRRIGATDERIDRERDCIRTVPFQTQR